MLKTPLSFAFVQAYKNKTPPWGPLGYITYKRTYARPLDNDKTEEWWQTVERCVKGIVEIDGVFTQAEIEELYYYVFNLKCTFGGRSLWQLGTPTVQRLGADSLQNCWLVAIDDLEAFCFVFNELMLGGGVSFNMQQSVVYSMPTVQYNIIVERKESWDVDFIVPDNREGWVELLRKVLQGFFYTGKNFTYSTGAIRSKGKKIKTFGGDASGPEELVKGITQIIKIIKNRLHHKLRPIDCMDIMNIIGSIVVAGNVRRSAELALGDPNDYEFLLAKRWDLGSIPNWRAMSNNSICINSYDDIPEAFWEGYVGNGEPYGIVNIDNCRKYGRMRDGLNHKPDSHVMGVNPCAEITLESHEACNLVEIFVPMLEDITEFKAVAGLMYKVAKTISRWPFMYKETNEVAQRNHRIGIGLTGLMQAHQFDYSDMSAVYNYLIDLDEQYSKRIGCNESIKLTTIKPSGTLSLLPGVPPGMHVAYAPYYIRRIRMATNSPLVEVCRQHGYHIEPQLGYDGEVDPNTIVVDFPVENTNCIYKATAIDQLGTLKNLQYYWSDNSVSCTVYYRKEELPLIQRWLENNISEVKSVSFLLHSEHGFKQAPLEEISKEKYEELKSKTKPITQIDGETTEDLDLLDECETGGCPIR